MISEYKKYIASSQSAANQAAIVYDLARSAEKMTDPQYVGEDNKAWQEGPFICAFPKQEDIKRDQWYIVKTSAETSAIAQRAAKKKRMILPNVDGSRVEACIARLMVIEQFEIFKEFAQKVSIPYNKKRVKQANGSFPDRLLERTSRSIDKRNEAVHEPEKYLVTMKEAVEYYYDLASQAATYCKFLK